MSEHRYPSRALSGAYIRAAAGVLLTAGPLAAFETNPVVAVILGAMALLFLVYGARTAVQQLTLIRVDDCGVSAVGPLPLDIEWRSLASVKLNYYTTRRDGREGWLQLNLRGTGRTMRIESTLDGFPEIVERAIRMAYAQGVELSPATCNNLRPLGIPADPEERRGGA